MIRKTLLLILYTSVTLPVLSQFALPDDEYAQRVNEKFQQEDWITGKQLLDEGLKRYPKNSDLKTLMGKYYFEWEKNNDKARFVLIEALQADGQNASAKQILVNVEIASKRYSSAICYINELLEINPYWKGLWTKKIEVHRMQGNQVEANRLLKRLRQIYPEDKAIRDSYVYYMKEEIRVTSKNGEVDEAITLANTLIKEEPKNEEAYLELCNSYLKAGDYEKALITSERGLYQLPGNMSLINKKTDILSALHRFDELLSFLQAEIKNGTNCTELNRKYNYFLEESARHKRKSDVYVTYRVLQELNPENEEYFNYVISHSIGNGLYEDALETINRTRQVKGESKSLLLKEHQVYHQMGATSKANQQIVKLYQLFPEDTDITDMYVQLRYQRARSSMQDEQYLKAIDELLFVIRHGDEDMKQTGRGSLFNCYYQTGKYEKALSCLDTLIANNPVEPNLRAKRAMIYSERKMYPEALSEYEKIISMTVTEDKEVYRKGYDELATTSVKQLIEKYDLKKALQLTDEWLKIYPQSEMAHRYAINISARMNNYEGIKKYALAGMNAHPEDIYYQIKLAEAYNHLKDHKLSLEILSRHIADYPYNVELVNAYTQSSEDYVRKLIKEREYAQGMAIVEEGIKYNPKNRPLKYWKGVLFEKTNQTDSAYHYQLFYDPALIEVRKHTRHLDYLNYQAYRNDVSFYYLRSRYGNDDKISSIASVEYTRFGTKNTFTGRGNFAGREDGKGIQGEFEWSHTWKPYFYTRVNASLANKYFPKFIVNASMYKAFKKAWEVELGGGYRRLQDKTNMFNGVVGIAKEWEAVWLNLRPSLHYFHSNWHYNVLAQGRFYLDSAKYYLSFMGSLGSAPDMSVINYQLYDVLSPTNSMVGLGLHWLINNKFAVACLGTWYNYKDDYYVSAESPDYKYRNMYNLYFQFHVKF